MTYYCFLHVFYLPFSKDKNEPEKVTTTISGIGIEYTSSSKLLFIIWEDYHNLLKSKCNILQILLLLLDSYN